jgi:uncharacterized protein YukE
VRFIYGDPDELDRLAGRLRSRADGIRRLTDDQVTRGNAAHWQSVSAQTYRDRLARDRAEAERVAEHLEQAATALQAHAQEIRQLLAQIAHAEQEVTDWFGRKAREAISAVGSIVNQVIHGDLPWSGWPYTPQSLPPPGDMKWLEVGQFMRRQGVS